MTLSDTPRPPKAERDAQRRAEIVTAARHCVVRNGFHAASMAQIAAQAQMSVGQIYRYFASKDDIVQTLVEDLVHDRLAWITRTGGRPDLARLLGHRLPDEDRAAADDRVLQLEITAEATRNPRVADALREADRRLHAQAVRLVRADYPRLTAKQASARVEVMAVLSEGTAFRKLADSAVDPRELTALYRTLIEALFPAPG